MLELVERLSRSHQNIESVNLEFWKTNYGLSNAHILLTVSFFGGEVYEGEGDDVPTIVKEFEKWLEEEYNVPEQG